jgi:hypothetical protein
VRLKTLPPLIWLTLLLTRPIFAQTPKQSPEGSANVYGIELESSYPGTTLLELMKTAEEEIDAAVDEAYAEGYKAGVMEYAPEAALYKALTTSMEKTLETERKKSRFFWPAVGISAGASFAMGFLCSLLIAGR